MVTKLLMEIYLFTIWKMFLQMVYFPWPVLFLPRVAGVNWSCGNFYSEYQNPPEMPNPRSNKKKQSSQHHIWKKHGVSSQKLDVRCNIISSLATRFQLIFHRKTWDPPYESPKMPGPGSVMCPPLIRTWTKRVKVLGFWADPGWWVGWDTGRWVTFDLQILVTFFWGRAIFLVVPKSPLIIIVILLLLILLLLLIYLFSYVFIYLFVIWVFNLFFWLWCGCPPPQM